MNLMSGRRRVDVGLNVASQLSGFRHCRELRVLEFTNTKQYSESERECIVGFKKDV